MRIKLLTTVVLIIAFCSCKKTNEMASDTEILTINPKALSSIDNLLDLDDFKTIILETNDQNLIGRTSKIKISDNKIFILDRNFVIYVFDIDGYYLHTIDRLGPGPEEYLQLDDFDVYNSNVYICSRVEKKIKVYNLTGDFITSYNLDDDWYSYIEIHYPIAYLYADYSSMKLKSLTIYNLEKEKVIGEYIPIKKNHSISLGDVPFLSNSNKLTLLTQKYNFNIYELVGTSVKVNYSLYFKTKDQLPSDFEDIEDLIRLPQRMFDKDAVLGVRMPYIYNDKLYFSYIYEFRTHISVVNLEDKSDKTFLVYDENSIFKHSPIPFGFIDGYLMTLVESNRILEDDRNYPSDKNIDGILKEDDNPIIFLHKLK